MKKLKKIKQDKQWWDRATFPIWSLSARETEALSAMVDYIAKHVRKEDPKDFSPLYDLAGALGMYAGEVEDHYARQGHPDPANAHAFGSFCHGPAEDTGETLQYFAEGFNKRWNANAAAITDPLPEP